MAADALAPCITKPSAAMVLIQFLWNNLVTALEVLTDVCYFVLQ